MKLFSIRCAVALALTLGGCGATTSLPEIDEGLAKAEAKKQRILVVEEKNRLNSRLASVSRPILTANAELCPETAHTNGLRIIATRDGDEDLNEALRAVFDLGEHAKIVQVLPDSPAASAGLLKGDEIIAVNGVTVPKEADVEEWVPEALGDADEKGQAYDVAILRNGKQKTLRVAPEKSCGYPVVLNNDGAVNAFADGSRIIITSGMMRFASDDNHLALVVGHELAHNTMTHVRKKQGNYLLGAILGAAVSVVTGVDLTQVGGEIAAGINSQEFEAEADYVGVYYTARAGYDIANVAKFWRLMAVAHPKSIHLAGTTHPSSAKRFLAIERTRDEIKTKQAAGEALRPEPAEN